MEISSNNFKRALVLLSGGLDSTLSLQMIKDQGIDIIAVNFMSPFCTCSRSNGSCKHLAGSVAKKLGVPIRVVDKGMEYIRVVENPQFGYGRGLNPCIDCRIFILKKAREIMIEADAGFVVTGEVLGQRPMSQRRDALNIIERESDLKGLILRPLSAHLFEPTIPEKLGYVNREKLLSIAGRSRKIQLQMADELHIDLFGCPAGGCRLTDKETANRLRDLFKHNPAYTYADVKLALIGRHFRIHPELKVILGRNQAENQKLMALTGDRYPHKYEPLENAGPLLVACGTIHEEDKKVFAFLLRNYTKNNAEQFSIHNPESNSGEIISVAEQVFSQEQVDSIRI